MKEGEVGLVVEDLVLRELFLLKSYFEEELQLPLPPLFKDIVCHLGLAPNQLCINIVG